MVGNGDNSYDDPSGPIEVPRTPEEDYQESGGSSETFSDKYSEAHVWSVDSETYDADKVRSTLKSSDEFTQDDISDAQFRNDYLVVLVEEEGIIYGLANDADVNHDGARDRFSGLFDDSEDPLEPDDEESRSQNEGKAPRVSKFGGGSPFDRDRL